MPSWQDLRKLPVVARPPTGAWARTRSRRKTKQAAARIAGVEVTESVCPYCAVGCGKVVYTKGGKLLDIEGNPRSPINQGTLCPKASASRQLVQSPSRLTEVK